MLKSLYQIDPKDIFTLQQDGVTMQGSPIEPRINRSIGQHFSTLE